MIKDGKSNCRSDNSTKLGGNCNVSMDGVTSLSDKLIKQGRSGNDTVPLITLNSSRCLRHFGNWIRSISDAKNLRRESDATFGTNNRADKFWPADIDLGPEFSIVNSWRLLGQSTSWRRALSNCISGMGAANFKLTRLPQRSFVLKNRTAEAAQVAKSVQEFTELSIGSHAIPQEKHIDVRDFGHVNGRQARCGYKDIADLDALELGHDVRKFIIEFGELAKTSKVNTIRAKSGMQLEKLLEPKQVHIPDAWCFATRHVVVLGSDSFAMFYLYRRSSIIVVGDNAEMAVVVIAAVHAERRRVNEAVADVFWELIEDFIHYFNWQVLHCKDVVN